MDLNPPELTKSPPRRELTLSKDRRPPTVDDAVLQFMDASWEYLELMPVLGTAWTGFGPTPSGTRAEIRTTRRVIVLGMTLGRKFVRRGEPTYLPGLITRVERERRDRLTPKQCKQLRGFSAGLTQEVKSLYDQGLTIRHPDGSETGPAEFWERVSYGTVFHADHGKYAEGIGHAWQVNTYTAMQALPRLRSLIVQTRQALEALNDDGVFDGVVSEDTIFVDGDVWSLDGTVVGSVRGDGVKVDSARRLR